MKGIAQAGLVVAAAIALGAAALATSPPAKADIIQLGMGSDGYFSIGYRSRNHYGRSHRYGRRPRFSLGFIYRPRYNYRRYAPRVRTYRGYNSSACHSVVKHDYWHGHEAEIGGVMCYDRYGNSYMVPESRYLIQYY